MDVPKIGDSKNTNYIASLKPIKHIGIDSEVKTIKEEVNKAVT